MNQVRNNSLTHHSKLGTVGIPDPADLSGLGLLFERGTIRGTGASAVTFNLSPRSSLTFANHPRRMVELCLGGTRLPGLIASKKELLAP